MADDDFTPNARGLNESLSQLDKKTQVLKMYASGKTLTEICATLAVDSQTIYNWRSKDTVFDSECSSAQNIGFEIQADALHTIYDGDDVDVNKARGKSDNIKWLLTKRAAHKYGDRVSLDVTNSIDLKGALIDARDRLAKLPQSTIDPVTQAIDITPQLEKTTAGTESVAETDPDQVLLEDILK